MAKREKLLIGSHVSFRREDQLLGSLKEALQYQSTTFMFYTGAPQNTLRYPIDLEITKAAREEMRRQGIDPETVIVHAPYIINLANVDEEKHQFSIRFLKEELKRCEQLGIQYMVLHPGSHVGSGIDLGIEQIIDGLNQILKDTNVMILLETMAGKGSEIGSRFEELHRIIAGVHEQSRIGVCLDTCHLHDAGYDVKDFDHLLDEFDRIVGLSYVHCIHINDSKNPQASHKDRHENIGFGAIGFEALLKIIEHPKLQDIPKILETPYIDRLYPPYKEEIEMIRARTFDPKLQEEIMKKQVH